MTARVLIVGPPGAGRTTLACRLVEVATRGKDPFASLLPLEEELRRRGLRREDPEARRGSRTTRQALDRVLRDGDVAAGSAEVESLFLGPLELVDVPGAHYSDDSLAQDPLSPLRALARDAAALVLVLDAKTWCDPAGVREVERDRAVQTIRRVAAGRTTPLPVAVVLAKWDLVEAKAPPPAFEELAALADRETGVSARRLWLDRGFEPALIGLARWLIDVSPRAQGGRAPLVAALVGALLLGAYLLHGALAWRAIAAAPPGFTAEEERAFLERAERRLGSVWLAPFPRPRDELAAHARNLEQLLRREHPAVWEPVATVGLAPAQYVSAARALAVVDRHAGADPDRTKIEETLLAKARVAEMPPARPDTLPAWEELWRTTNHPVVRDAVIAPRIRPVVAFLLREAEREADGAREYPALLEPVRRVQRAHVPVADDLADSAQERAWARAFDLLFPGPSDVASISSVLKAVPERPPASFLRRAGVLAGEALLAEPPRGSAPLDELLGAEGARGALAAVAPAYSAMTTLGRDAGPARLASLTSAVATLPRAALPELDRARLERFEEHLRALATPRGYSVRVVRAAVSPRFDAFYDAFDAVIAASSEATPEKKLGPFDNRRLVEDEALFGPGELAWKPWDRVEVRLVDDNRSVGVAHRDPGSCFGLRSFLGEWRDATGDGTITLEVSPPPVAAYDFRGWPER